MKKKNDSAKFNSFLQKYFKMHESKLLKFRNLKNVMIKKIDKTVKSKVKREEENYERKIIKVYSCKSFPFSKRKKCNEIAIMLHSDNFIDESNENNAENIAIKSRISV